MLISHAHFTCSFYMLILHAHFTCSFYMLILHAHFTCSFYMLILHAHFIDQITTLPALVSRPSDQNWTLRLWSSHSRSISLIIPMQDISPEVGKKYTFDNSCCDFELIKCRAKTFIAMTSPPANEKFHWSWVFMFDFQYNCFPAEIFHSFYGVQHYESCCCYPNSFISNFFATWCSGLQYFGNKHTVTVKS